jgi:ferredoxin-NADP reductase
MLSGLVPDIDERDVFVCGPSGFTASVRHAADALGVDGKRVHHESFAF